MVSEPVKAPKPARVLLVQDDLRASTMMVEMLRAAWPEGLLVIQCGHVSDALEELVDHGATCVLLELAGGEDAPLGALRELSAAAPEVPIVVISEPGETELGIAAVRAGAQDHLLCSELQPALLARAVRYAIERKRAEVSLSHQALQDPLTGLPNRVLFADRLSVALDRSRRIGLAPAIMFLDLDAFKEVNDSLGHAAGDRLLRVLAERFRALLRPMDTVARIGGDEFTFLFEGLGGADEALAIARRITEAAATPVALGALAGATSVSVSIGIAMVEDPTASLDDAIRDADAAMYRAKDLGGARAELYDERARRRVAPPASKVELDDKDALGAAIQAGQLRVHYQPRVSINGETGLVGFEALVRWEHPERGLLLPAEFIGLAERTGLIGPLEDWVIDQALTQVSRWRLRRPAVTISVNLSRRQLDDPRLGARLSAAIHRASADPAVLWLELAEEAVIDDPESAGHALRRLREIGVGLAIDDFGRGSSSLESLRHLPVDMLKIDRSVVSRLGWGRVGVEGADPEAEAAVGAVVELGHALGLSVIAEGVETDHQLAHLRDLRCDGAQGFLFSRPVPEGEVRELLTPAGRSPSRAGSG